LQLEHDAPGLVLFGEQALQAVPAHASRHHAEEIFQLLTHAQAQGGTRIDQNLFRIVETFTRRGMAVVISDFFSAEAAVKQLLRALHGQHQEVLVFHILAPEELDLPYEGEHIFEDLETAAEIPVQADDFRKEYQRRVTEFCEGIKQECVNLEFDYQQLRTDAPLFSNVEELKWCGPTASFGSFAARFGDDRLVARATKAAPSHSSKPFEYPPEKT